MEISSKLTLYDTLGMLIPGFVILWWFQFFQIDIASWENVLLIPILSYLVGLIYHRVIECLMVASCMRRNTCMLKKTWKKTNDNKEIPKSIQEEYDKAYTKIAKENCLFSIPVLEAQEIFMRNSFVLIIGSIIKLCIDGVEFLYIVLLFVLFLLTIIFWIQSLYKVYGAVWESEKYLDTIKRDESSPKEGLKNPEIK